MITLLFLLKYKLKLPLYLRKMAMNICGTYLLFLNLLQVIQNWKTESLCFKFWKIIAINYMY